MSERSVDVHRERRARLRRAAVHPLSIGAAAAALPILNLGVALPALSIAARLEVGLGAPDHLPAWLSLLALGTAALAIVAGARVLGRGALLPNRALDAIDRALALAVAAAQLRQEQPAQDACVAAAQALADAYVGSGRGGLTGGGPVAADARALAAALARGEVAPAHALLGVEGSKLFAAAAQRGAGAAVLDALAEHESFVADAAIDEAIDAGATRALVYGGCAVLVSALAFVIPYAQVFGSFASLGSLAASGGAP